MPDEHDTPHAQTDQHRAAHEEVVPDHVVDDSGQGPTGLSKRLDTGTGFLVGILMLMTVPVALICGFALFDNVLMLVLTFVAAIAGTLGMLWLVGVLLDDGTQAGH